MDENIRKLRVGIFLVLAILILGILIKVCQYFPSQDEDGAIIRPLPRVKAAISDPTALPHVVQLLLTFDPVLVEKVNTELSKHCLPICHCVV